MTSLIKDFIDYCAEDKFQLPVPCEEMEAASDKVKTVKAENRARTGAKEGLYPPAYFGGQYPDLWKIPVAADAIYYQKYKK